MPRETATTGSPRSLAMRLKCAAATWLLTEPWRQTNTIVVGLPDSASARLVAPASNATSSTARRCCMSELQEWVPRHGACRRERESSGSVGIQPALMNTQERLRVVPATPTGPIRVKSIARKASFFYLARVFHEVPSMIRRLPPLNALKAFEAAARHESFTRAAEELCVTQGAVSHQVKALEAELGVKLFHRERQRLAITQAGRAYLVVVRDAFDRIGDGTERLLQRQRGGALTVSTSPNFAAKWLVHRLSRFAETHPEIDLRVSASLHHVDFAREDIDLAIRHGDGTDSGLHVTRLCTEELFPVCSPKLVNGRNRLRAPSDLNRFALLHVNDRQGWRQWLDFADVGDVDAARGPILNQASMAIDAAVDGQGVALARTALAAWDLIGGRLVRPFDIAMPVSFAYWIVCSKAVAKLPKIVAFSGWLLAQAAEDARQLEGLKSRQPARAS